jgi:DNA-binding transcriptional LysR family regulator
MLDPRRLLTFREVARQGSFSRAADALALSQPAVSQQVGALERELGTALLVRGRAGTAPTPAGDLLLAHAEALASRLELADEQMEALVDTERRSLRVGAFPSALATIVPGALAALRDHDPDLDVSIEEGTVADLTAAVQSGRLHAVVCFQDASAPRREPDGLRRADLLEEPMVALLPAHHRLAGDDVIDLRELAGEPWMAPSTDGLIVAGCRAAGFEPRLVFLTRDPLASRAIAAAGLAVSLTPQLLARVELPGIAMPPLKKDPPRRTLYALLPAAGAHPLADPLLQALLQAATTAPPRLGSPPPANAPVTGSRSTA